MHEANNDDDDDDEDDDDNDDNGSTLLYRHTYVLLSICDSSVGQVGSSCSTANVRTTLGPGGRVQDLDGRGGGRAEGGARCRSQRDVKQTMRKNGICTDILS